MTQRRRVLTPRSLIVTVVVLLLVVLIRYIVVNARSAEGKTQLIQAIAASDADRVRWLLNTEANVNTPDRQGRTPLMWAIAYCRPQSGIVIEPTEDFAIVTLLVARGANVNAKDDHGNTALMTAANFPDASGFGMKKALDGLAEREVNLTSIILLLSHNAQVNVSNKTGDTPLILAAWHGNIDALTLLLAQGAKVNVKNKAGDTPLILAARKGSPDMLRLLLDQGADLAARNNQGTDALMAAATSATDNANVLLTHGADVTLHKADGTTALIAAAAAENIHAVQPLLDYGSDVEAQRADGSTPLIAAIRKARADSPNINLVVLALLNHHADVHAKDKQGHTALSLAQEKHLDTVVQMLKSAGAK